MNNTNSFFKIMKKIKKLMKISIIVIQTEGFSYLFSQGKEKIKRRDFSFLTPEVYKIPVIETNSESESFPSEYTEKKQIEKKFSVSVIIPSKNIKNLESLIHKINQQQGIQDLEIILIYSGINELPSFKNFNNVRVISINPDEFNHGRTRNLGAKESQGEYLIFLTDDGIPISNKLFYDLCKTISENMNVAASTAIQIPRSDSDLMHLFSLKQFYKMLELDNDRITECKNLDKLDSIEKRKLCQIDNVCSCYKRNIFLKYFFKDIQYAEDLELGIRFIKDGYKISQLAATGVIHSHRRNSMYYFKRSFVEKITLEPQLNYDIDNFSELKIFSIKDFLKNIFVMYNSICLTIDFLNKNQTLDILKAFKIINEKMLEYHSKTSKAISYDSSLNDFFHNLQFDNSNIITKNNFILSHYLNSLSSFQGYLKDTFPSLENIEIDFHQTLFKIFGAVMGANLGKFMIFAERHNTETLENLQNFKKIMIGGV